MASPDQVKQYLAYWFQLGKRVLLHRGREALLPQPVIQGDRYSPAFEACWQRVTDPSNGDCYLEGMPQTVAELLSPAWEVSPCARCEMPVPMPNMGLMDLGCPCADLPFWPDLDTPKPRSPVSSVQQLGQIRDRLMNPGQRSSPIPPRSRDGLNDQERMQEQSLKEQPSDGHPPHHHSLDQAQQDDHSMQSMRERMRASYSTSRSDDGNV